MNNELELIQRALRNVAGKWFEADVPGPFNLLLDLAFEIERLKATPLPPTPRARRGAKR